MYSLGSNCVVLPAAREVSCTRWFSYVEEEPGQPGVFEVDPVMAYDINTESAIRRFSYFNGKQFGPTCVTPEDAFHYRFVKVRLSSSPIQAWRGLSQCLV